MRLADRLLYILFPRRCIYCDKVIGVHARACKSCKETLPVMEGPYCHRCGRTRSLCLCKQHKKHFDTAVAAMMYVDGAKRAIYALKKEDDADLIYTMAQEMVSSLRARADAASLDVVTFIPMRKRDLRERGFNQSQLLAKDIARELRLPCKPLLTKIYDTVSQKTLPPIERSGNVLGVFEASPAAKGKRILLVDDLITTGYTLHECAKMLKIRGAEAVIALTFAASVPEKEEETSAPLEDTSE